MDLNQLQNEVNEWQSRNFTNKLPHHPLLGVGEEVGELMMKEMTYRLFKAKVFV